MTQRTPLSPSTLAAYYQQQLLVASPFSRALSGRGSGDLYLLPPHPDWDVTDQHSAMQSLVTSGVLSEYRYIDSKPQAAILAVRA